MSDEAYEGPLDQAIVKALAVAPQVVAGRSTAPARLDELLSLPLPEREAALTRLPRFLIYPVAGLALEKSEGAISCDLGLALALTGISRAAVARIDPRTCGGSQAVADMGAYALAMEGNVQRVCGNMEFALSAFGRSRELQKQGGIDPDLIAQIDLLEASLRRDLRQLDTALFLLDRATEAFLVLGEHKRWIQAQINRANVFLVMKEFDEAALILEALGEPSDSQVALCIRHNLASALASAGRFDEAERLLEEARDFYLRCSSPLIANRRLWLEGIIAEGLGQDERAGNLLSEVSADLDERGYAFDAALARLDLARLQADRGGEPLFPC